MEIYFFIIITYLLLLALLSSERRNMAFLVIGSIAIYWGFSYINAADVPAYMNFFKYCGTGINSVSNIKDPSLLTFEKGFIYYMGWIKLLVGGDYYFYQFVTLSIEFILTYVGLKKLLGNKKDVLIFFCIFATQLPLFIAAMRQGLVISVFIFSLSFVVKREYLKCIILYLLATVFHSSAVFLIGFVCIYWIFWNKFSLILLNKRFVISTFLLMNFLYFSGLNLSQLMSSLFQSILGYVGDMERDYTIYADEFSSASFGFLKLLEMDSIFIVIFLSSWIKKYVNTHYSILIYLFLIYYVLNLLVGGIVVHRLNYYLNIPYNFIVITSLLYMITHFFKISKIVAVFSVMTYYTIFFMFSNLSNGRYISEFHLFDIFKI